MCAQLFFELCLRTNPRGVLLHTAKLKHCARTAAVTVATSPQLWDCTGKHNQRWWKDANGALRPMHALSYCLGADGGNARAGAGVQVMVME